MRCMNKVDFSSARTVDEVVAEESDKSANEFYYNMRVVMRWGSV